VLTPWTRNNTHELGEYAVVVLRSQAQ
jgi:hypothetical protein